MARISVAPTDTLATIAAKVQEQMPNVQNFKLSRDPGHKGESRLERALLTKPFVITSLT